MYNIYISNFKRSDSVITTEEEMFSVPGSNFPVNKPMVKCSEDSADNFSFSMESNSPFYDSLLPLKTLIRVEYDGDDIFYGRVLNVSASTVFQTKSVICEGWYAFLNDSYYEGKQEKFRDKTTLEQYFTNILNNHNSNVPDKAIQKGNLIGMTLSTELKKYEPSSWTQSSSLIGNLTSNNGGHMRVRYVNKVAYLDWYKYYFRDLGDGLRPSVTVGKNILDISSEQSVDNIFTRVIPIGGSNNNGTPVYIEGYKPDGQTEYTSKAMPVSYIRNLYTDEELTDEFHSYKDYRDAESNYGIIYKTMSFGDANTQEKLWDLVKKWIKECYLGLADSFTVRALDFHIQDQNIPKILLGECVDVRYLIVRNNSAVWETRKLVCKSIQYDLFNPENNSYTFGFPTDILGYDQNGKKYSKQQSLSGTVGNTPKSGGGDDGSLTWREVWHMIGTQRGNKDYTDYAAAVSFYENGELSGTVSCFDPAVTGHETFEPQRDHEFVFNAYLVGKITLPGKSIKWVAVCDKGVFAYEINKNPAPVSYWYLEKAGTTYAGATPGSSKSDDYASIIEKDTDPYWGGTTAAESFRNNGRISGSVNKCYDPDACTVQEAQSDPSKVFSAQLIGKFTLNNTLKYVAISKQYGVFGFNASARGIIPASHWYTRVQGTNYDNTSSLVSEEKTGETYATSDGNPDSSKTIVMQPQESTGQGSTGEIKVGRDPNASGDGWKVKLNVPIQYQDADGNTQTKDGFVSASDFNVSEIPSFKTKLGIFDLVIANKVEAESILADLAYLRKLNSTSISADTYVSTDTLYTNKIFAHDTIQLASGGTKHYVYETSSHTFYYLDDCLHSLDASEEDGVITIIGRRLNGSTASTATFNMAATQFYKDAVAAATKDGYDSNHSMYISEENSSTKVTSVTLDPGDTKKYNPAFLKSDGETYQYGDLLTVNARAINNQDKGTIHASTSENTTITPDSEYDGISQVIIAKINNQNKGTVYATTSDQTYTPDSDYDGISKIIVGGVTTSNLLAENIKKDVIITVGDADDADRIAYVKGTYQPSIKLQDKDVVVPTNSTQTVYPDTEEGYDAMSSVKIGGVLCSSTFIASNIKSGVTISVGNSKSATAIKSITGTYTGEGSDFTGSDIDLNGCSSNAAFDEKPNASTYPITKGVTYFTGYVWGRLSDGKWHKLRSFSIATGARRYNILYNFDGSAYSKITADRLAYYTESSN